MSLNSAEAASKAMASGGMVDGRTLRLEVVEDKSGGGGPRSAQRSLLTTSPSTRSLALKCFNCSKTGHMAADCPRPVAIPMCNLCGRRHSDRCPLATECFRCYIPGHSARECRSKSSLGKYCTLCGANGHFRDSCLEVMSVPQHYAALDSSSSHEEWEEMYDAGQKRPYYVNKATGESSWSKPKSKKGLKGGKRRNEPKCTVCFTTGHYVCNGSPGGSGAFIDPDYVFRVTIASATEGSVPESLPELAGSCFNCGFGGHFGAECRRMKMDALSRNQAVFAEIRQMTKNEAGGGKRRGY